MDVMLIYWRTSSLMTLIHYWIIRRSTVSIMSTGVYGIYHLVVHVLVRKRLYTNNDICWLWQLWFISNLYFSTLFLIGKLHWYFLYESLYIQDGFTKVRWPTTGSRILGSTHMVSCDFSHLHLCVCVCMHLYFRKNAFVCLKGIYQIKMPMHVFLHVHWLSSEVLEREMKWKKNTIVLTYLDKGLPTLVGLCVVTSCHSFLSKGPLLVTEI